MTVFGERPEPARIRELRRAILMLGLLFVLWWIVEFLNFAGRIGMDPLDATGAAILRADGSPCEHGRRDVPAAATDFSSIPACRSGFIFLQSARTADRAFMKWISCRADPLRQRSPEITTTDADRPPTRTVPTGGSFGGPRIPTA
jgi:hypothetical protein